MTALHHLLLPLAWLSISTIALGHPGTDHSHDDVTPEASAPSARGLALPAIDGPKPWSDKPVLNDPNRFQIAIMTDRTGGHRPGIWMDAVGTLNKLRPEFVMSVGDLIEGYSGNRREVENQWQEFLGFIDKMDMRFFFVAGNHDLSNPMMHRVWRDHFGPEWYSFDYQQVHFVCLSSEDPQERIGDEQLAWLVDDLGQHADARWTLVFLHKPLWIYAEQAMGAGNVDNTQWKDVEKLLVDRPHTVFAGHVHHYVQYQRNGQQYFSLATTGGGSRLRGNQYGEFDHVMWLTMENDGPHLINLRLDGMLPAEVVTEQSITRFNEFLTKTSVEVAPILLDSIEGATGFSDGEVAIRLVNEFGEQVEMSGEIDGLPLRGLSVDPMQFQLTAAAGETAEQRVRVYFGKPMEFEALARTSLTATVRTTGDNPLSSERTIPVVIDRRFAFPSLAEMPAIDGQIDDWPEQSNTTPDEPLILGDKLGWQGNEDSSAKFFARHVGDKVYVAVRVTDERVIPDLDHVELLIDPRPVDQRSSDPQYAGNGLTISAFAPADGGGTRVVARRMAGNEPLANVEAKSATSDAGYDVEFVIPTELIQQFQGPDWHSVQGTLVLHDADQADTEPSQVVWRGTQRLREVNTGFGHFVREE